MRQVTNPFDLQIDDDLMLTFYTTGIMRSIVVLDPLTKGQTPLCSRILVAITFLPTYQASTSPVLSRQAAGRRKGW